MAASLLRRVPNDSTIWQEVEQNAEQFVRFYPSRELQDPVLVAWCAEHGCEPAAFIEDATEWFVLAARDDRSKALLTQRGSRHGDVVSLYDSETADKIAFQFLTSDEQRADYLRQRER